MSAPHCLVIFKHGHRALCSGILISSFLDILESWSWFWGCSGLGCRAVVIVGDEMGLQFGSRGGPRPIHGGTMQGPYTLMGAYKIEIIFHLGCRLLIMHVLINTHVPPPMSGRQRWLSHLPVSSPLAPKGPGYGHAGKPIASQSSFPLGEPGQRLIHGHPRFVRGIDSEPLPRF